MKENEIISIINKTIGTDKIEYLSGNILKVGSDKCCLSSSKGSVYGIAIKIDNDNEKLKVFNAIKKEKACKIKINEWIELKNKFYPLYWGKDTNMGIRLYSHTKSMKSTNTLRLNKIKGLDGYEIIYGAVPCINYKIHEESLHNKYKDLMKTKKGQKDEIKMEEVNCD